VLDNALEAAGIAREDAYVTNVVKHFKWVPRGKRRLHKTPAAREVRACLPWLRAELEFIRPQVMVCLGATAARALLGEAFRVSRQHGEIVDSPLAPHATATLHPSAILRMRDADARSQALSDLVADLEKVAGLLQDD
jgi:DNA polymerase